MSLADEQRARDPGQGAHDRPIPSRVAIMHHPMHPMAVVFPIAFLMATFATDSVFWWLGDVFWARASFWLLAAGLASGLGAALLGFADFVLMREVRRHVAAWSHFIVAVMALSLAGANLRLRLEDAAAGILPWGIALSGAMVLLVSIAGWLGGTLTFRHGIGTYSHADDERSDLGRSDSARPPGSAHVPGGSDRPA
jgi:uncharacterized membrane protein